MRHKSSATGSRLWRNTNGTIRVETAQDEWESRRRKVLAGKYSFVAVTGVTMGKAGAAPCSTSRPRISGIVT